MNKIWFVVHEHSLWEINNRIIGFWNKKQNYDPISAGDTIIYYRSGEKEKIKGIFKVLFKGKDIDAHFSTQKAQERNLCWQCVLTLETKVRMFKNDMDILGSRLSFYDNFVKCAHGAHGIQVFPADHIDIYIIMNDFSVIEN